jgi:outer membrane lipoprotein SlyB
MKASGIPTLVALVAVVPLVAGCPAHLGSDDYSRDQARQAMEVQMGAVEQVRTVNIEGTKSVVGPGAGAVVGGVAGSGVGGGRGSVIAATVGAVLGGVGGAAVEEAVTRKTGIEVTVRLDNGRLIAVTQEDSGEAFAVGDRVRVLTGGGATRVSH